LLRIATTNGMQKSRSKYPGPLYANTLRLGCFAEVYGDAGVTPLIEAGKVMPVIDRTFPLKEAPQAIRYLEQGHARGKVVVTVSN
jgi:hypothetical protein